MRNKKDIYYEPAQVIEWVAYVRQNGDNKAYPIKLGKFSNWLSARNAANERFGANQVVLVEPK